MTQTQIYKKIGQASQGQSRQVDTMSDAFLDIYHILETMDQRIRHLETLSHRSLTPYLINSLSQVP